MSTVNREELKRLLLELLRSDREFRRAVAAEVGLLEILERLDRLEERMVKLEERIEEHTRAIRSLQEQVVKLQEQMVKLQEQVAENTKAIKALQEETRKLWEAVKDLQEQVKALQRQVAEHTKAILKLEERLEEHAEAIRRLQAHVTAIGHRYGVATEEAFRSAIEFLVQDLLREYSVETWEYYDSEGIVYGHPAVVQVDVLIRDDIHILVEYKAAADRGDVAELYRIGLLYEKVTGVKPRLLLVAADIRRRALDLAKKLGVEVRSMAVEGRLVEEQ